MSKFNPKDHTITMGRNREYLETKWRLVWFREENPNGRIDTDIQLVGEVGLVKATIWNNDGVHIASGMATIRAAENAKVTWAGRDIEKAETAAIGRALAHAGYGTQFVGDEMSEGDYLADSPIDNYQSEPPTPTASELWERTVKQETSFLYDHPNHQTNSIEALLKNGVIKDTDKPVVSIIQILMHRAARDYGLNEDEFKAVLGGSVSDFMKSVNGSYRLAWTAVVESQADKAQEASGE